MTPVTINMYMENMISKYIFFYRNNTNSKYFPESVGLLNISDKKLADLYSLEYCREVFDLYNKEALNRAHKTISKHISPLRPKYAMVERSGVWSQSKQWSCFLICIKPYIVVNKFVFCAHMRTYLVFFLKLSSCDLACAFSSLPSRCKE